MNYLDAFQLIAGEIERTPGAKVRAKQFDEQVFGNFLIDYRQGWRRRQFVNDRGNLYYISGWRLRSVELVAIDLRDETDEALLAIIRSKSR